MCGCAPPWVPGTGLPTPPSHSWAQTGGLSQSCFLSSAPESWLLLLPADTCPKVFLGAHAPLPACDRDLAGAFLGCGPPPSMASCSSCHLAAPSIQQALSTCSWKAWMSDGACFRVRAVEGKAEAVQGGGRADCSGALAPESLAQDSPDGTGCSPPQPAPQHGEQEASVGATGSPRWRGPPRKPPCTGPRGLCPGEGHSPSPACLPSPGVQAHPVPGVKPHPVSLCPGGPAPTATALPPAQPGLVRWPGCSPLASTPHVPTVLSKTDRRPGGQRIPGGSGCCLGQRPVHRLFWKHSGGQCAWARLGAEWALPRPLVWAPKG